MLVLTRKTNQSISLGENIRVTVLDVEGDRVSIGIDAPREVRIFRSELIDDTMKQNRESLESANFSPGFLKKKKEIE
ncbi:MAG: carbon storage regulator CsrA [Oscillospiraceae bacterium]|nr:carbon storage regulator CsrA [Oscillospiraceae bacterium]